MKRSIAFASAALALAAAPVCLAGDDTLTIGDKAPAIDIEHWVKGKEIEKFEKDKVYVLEFWATWCGPCIASMPHLSALQEEYKDYGVTFIGVSDESLELVEKFLKQTYKKDGKLQSERIQYTLTTDPDKSVKKDFFTAAGQSGIPCSFIIGKTGQIEYIGHPMSMDKALEGVVRDTWDREAFKVEFENEKKLNAIQGKIRKATQSKDWKTMYELYGKAIELGHNNANMLNTMAWTIATDKGIEKRDLDLALTAAERCNELTDFENAMYLDTIARVHYEMGHLEKAIKLQAKAVEMLTEKDESFRKDMEDALKKYKKEMK